MNNKLKLEDLRVDSFATSEEALDARGTVVANQAITEDRTCAVGCDTQAPQNTCYNTCPISGTYASQQTAYLCPATGIGTTYSAYYDCEVITDTTPFMY